MKQPINNTPISTEDALILGVDVTKEGTFFVENGLIVTSRYNKNSKDSRMVPKFLCEIVGKKNASHFLMQNVSLSPSVKLKDIFIFTMRHAHIVEPVIGNWCLEYSLAGLEDIKVHNNQYDANGIEYLELYWIISTSRKKVDGVHEIYGIDKMHFHGVGFELQEDVENMGKKGSRINWGIGLGKVNEISDLPLKIKNDLILAGEEDFSHKKAKKFAAPETSLLNIIHSVFWELSFHGSPASAQMTAQDLKQRVDELKEDLANGKEFTAI